jgi:DNA-binding NarL/FixJ family response regulator
MIAHAGEVLCTEIVPRIRSAIPTAVIPISAEDKDELIQDTIAIAAALLHRAEGAGKKVTPGNLAYFAVKLTRAGRRSTGSSKTDVMHPGTQLSGRTRLTSFDEPVGFDEAGNSITLADVFANDQEDPGTSAARNMDWQTFYGKQTTRGQRLSAVVAEGCTMRDVARMLGLSDSGIQLEKKKLGVALADFMGTNILSEVNRQPMWRNNIVASRERRACRGTRTGHSTAGGAAYA